ncbi:MAG: hypothetical protein KAH18_07345 [Psychromonas sp.]|nr:hypothetical protein [Psychromonas sp.]
MSQTKIAEQINVSQSLISRELNVILASEVIVLYPI